MLRRTAGWLLLIVVISSVSAVQAAEPDDAALTQAKAALDEGFKLYFNDNNAEAIEHFERAGALFEQELGLNDSRTLYALLVLGKIHLDLQHHAHAEKCLSCVVEQSGTDTKVRAELKAAALWDLGRVHLETDANDEAVDLYNQAKTVFLEVLKQRDLSIAELLFELAIAEERLKRYDDARRHFAESWKTYENATETDGELAVEILKKLAGRLFDAGEYCKTQQHIGELVRLCESIYGPKSEQTASAVRRLGVAYEATNDFDSARKHLARAAEIAEDLPANEVGDALRSWRDLALLEMNLGEFGRAEKSAAKYVSRLRERRGVSLAMLADAEIAMAMILTVRGKHDEARRYLEGVVEELTPVFKELPRQWARALSVAGLLETETGNYEKAIELHKQAILAWKEMPGSRDVRDELGSLGRAQIAYGQFPSACKSLDEALALVNEENEQFEVANLYISRAIADVFERDAAAARPLLDRAAGILQATLPPDHHFVSDLRVGYGILYLETGEHDKATAEFEEARTICHSRYGEMHSKTAEAIDYLGQVHLAKNERDQAEKLLKQALSIRRKCLGADHPDTAKSLYHMGLLLLERDDTETAIERLNDALEIRAKRLGTEHQATLETRAKLQEAKMAVSEPATRE